MRGGGVGFVGMDKEEIRMRMQTKGERVKGGSV